MILLKRGAIPACIAGGIPACLAAGLLVGLLGVSGPRGGLLLGWPGPVEGVAFCYGLLLWSSGMAFGGGGGRN